MNKDVMYFFLIQNFWLIYVSYLNGKNMTSASVIWNGIVFFRFSMINVLPHYLFHNDFYRAIYSANSVQKVHLDNIISKEILLKEKSCVISKFLNNSPYQSHVFKSKNNIKNLSESNQFVFEDNLGFWLKSIC